MCRWFDSSSGHHLLKPLRTTLNVSILEYPFPLENELELSRETLKMTKIKKTVSKPNIASTDYAQFVTQLKKQIRSAQFKAALAVNRELIRLYWDIGREIVERQEKDGWGSAVIDRVARDIQNEFPGIEGFSKTNMGRMRAFYLAYSISPQAVGKLDELPIFNIPWGHNIAIFEGAKSLDERLWYVNMVIQGKGGLGVL